MGNVSTLERRVCSKKVSNHRGVRKKGCGGVCCTVEPERGEAGGPPHVRAAGREGAPLSRLIYTRLMALCLIQSCNENLISAEIVLHRGVLSRNENTKWRNCAKLCPMFLCACILWTGYTIGVQIRHFTNVPALSFTV